MEGLMGQIMPGFLDNYEIANLRYVAMQGNAWTKGRQGTGYEILSLQHLSAPGGTIGEIVRRARKHVGDPPTGNWDSYLIRYHRGDYVPKHRDEAALEGMIHRRLNALVTMPQRGGDLWVAGELIELNVGDAFLFDPGTEEHEVTKCGGDRLLLSVGAYIEEKKP
jgi:hypothetical protein